MNPKQWTVRLSDGHFIPILGFGTYAPQEVPKSKATEATKIAIDAGFRHIDSAALYQNEKELGLAIRSKIADGTVKREDIFYTSKVWCTFNQPERVQLCLEQSLKQLQLDYVDLYLIHFPIAMKPGEDYLPKDENGKIIFDVVDICATWEAMEKCKDAGLAKSIGVSNFNRRQLEKILNKPGLKHKPVCNQVECHLYLNQRKLLDFCKSKDIVLVAYSALGSHRDTQWVDQKLPALLDDPVLCAIARKYKRTPALIALRYQLERGVVVLAKSFTEKRIKENVQVFEFQLTSEDMKVLDGLNKNIRYIDGSSSWCRLASPEELAIIHESSREFPKSKAKEVTKITIDAGFCHFDSASVYNTEDHVGEAIREKIANGTMRREDIFYTSKVMEKCKDAGLAKSIGVSNFNCRQLEKMLNKPGLKHRPVCNQVFEFQLSSEDMKVLDGLNRNMRYITAAMFEGHPNFPFSDEN